MEEAGTKCLAEVCSITNSSIADVVDRLIDRFFVNVNKKFRIFRTLSLGAVLG